MNYAAGYNYIYSMYLEFCNFTFVLFKLVLSLYHIRHIFNAMVFLCIMITGNQMSAAEAFFLTIHGKIIATLFRHVIRNFLLWINLFTT